MPIHSHTSHQRTILGFNIMFKKYKYVLPFHVHDATAQSGILLHSG
jgi:hypothetical protein